MKTIIVAASTLLTSASLIANGQKDSNIREEKSSYPMISFHPTANQAAATAYYKAMDKNIFNGTIPLKYAQLVAI